MKQKSKLALLLRNGLRDTFMPAPPPESQTAGKRRRRRASGRTYLMGVVFSWLILVALLSVYLVMAAYAFRTLGMLDLLLLIGIVGASITALVLSVFRAKSLLFNFRDYDLICSLPFPMRMVVTSRFFLMYIWNLVYSLALMLPSGIIYAIFQGVSAGFWPVWIVLTLFVPLLPSVIAGVLGILIGLISRHFKKHAGTEIVVTVAFLIVWMLFVNSLNDVTDVQMANAVSSILSVMSSIYPLAPLALAAAKDLNMGSLALFCGISLAAYIVFVAITGKYFRRIHSALAATRITSNYRLGRLAGTTARKALVRREWKRLIGISGYFMNVAVGPILMVVFSIMIIFGVFGVSSDMSELAGEDITTSMLGIHLTPGIMIGMFFGLFVMISAPTDASISLEGNTLWILKTAPVPTWEILRAKLVPGIAMSTLATAISGTILWILFSDTGIWGIFFFLIPISYGVFASLFGLYLNLKYPDFEWTTPMRPIKQAKPVTIQTFAGMGIALGGALLMLVLGDIMPIAMVCAMLASSVLLYRNLRTKGVAQFDSFNA